MLTPMPHVVAHNIIMWLHTPQCVPIKSAQYLWIIID